MATRFLNNIKVNDAYTLPSNDGTDGQAIITDGNGNLSFGAVAAASAENAEAVHLEVKNTSGATINKGTPVYITGNVGNTNKLEIAPADASDAAKMPAVGLLETTLSNNAEGYVAQGGYLKALATATIDGTSASSNDTVYVKAGGGLTLTKPTGTNYIQNVAKVARVDSSNGSLVVSSILRTNDVPTPLHIDHANQRLGIGTTTPGYKLEVDGSAAVDSLTIDGTDVTASAAEINILDGVTATTAEINKLDGLTATTTELNYVDGVTSNIQTQLDNKISNVTTNLSTTANGTSLTINSSDGTNASIPAATTSAWGAMTDEDKTKLDGIDGSANNYTLPTATTSQKGGIRSGTGLFMFGEILSVNVASSTVRGGIKVFSDTDQTVAANTVSSTANRTYGVQLNSNNQAVVNVPWTNTNTDTDVNVANLRDRLGDISDDTTIGDASDVDITFSGGIIVSGDLTVSGTTTTVNSNTVNIGDNILVLNSDEAGTPSQNGGIEIERGTATNARIQWDEANDYWEAGLAGSEVQLALVNGTYSGLRAQATTKADVGLSNVPNSDHTAQGYVNTSGTPADNDFAKFTGANTVEGRSYSEVRDDLGLATTSGVRFDNLGIGQSPPGTSGRINAAEHVIAAGNFYASGTGGFVFGTSTSQGEHIYRSGNDIRVKAGGSDILTVDGDDGRVGIGTTNPQYKLHVSGNSFIDATSSGATLTLGRAPGEPTIKAHTDDGGYLLMDSTDNVLGLNWYSSQNVILANGGGNVGISTTSPNAKLEIGSAYGDAIILKDSRTSTTATFEHGISFSHFNNYNNGIYFQHNDYFGTGRDKLLLKVGNDTRMVVDHTGNVGIGTTSPGAKLDISGIGTISTPTTKIINSSSETFCHSAHILAPNLTAGENNILVIGRAASTKNAGYIGYKYSSAGANANVLTFGHWASDNLMNLTGDGKLGIGTTSPSEKLDIAGGAKMTGRIQVGSNASSDSSIISQSGDIQLRVGSINLTHNPFIRLQGNSGSSNVYADIKLDTVNQLLIFNDPGTTSGSIGQNPMVLNASGDVGIGTTSPAVSLDINATDAIALPTGTTAQRPSSPAAGMFRYNTTNSEFEGYTTSWGSIGGGSGGTTNVVVDTFSGDGSDTTFDITNTIADEDNVQVYIDGVYQSKSNYSTSGTTITFSTAPPSGTNNIEVTHFVQINGAPSIEVDTFSGNASTTAFTLTTAPVTKNNLQIYIDGVYQAKANYSVSSTTLTFTTAPGSGTNNIEVTHLKIS